MNEEENFQKAFEQMLAAYSSKPLWTPPSESETPAESEDVPVLPGSVIGYRAWRILDWQLYGTGVNRAWVPGVNEATCDAGRPIDASWGLTISFGPSPEQHPAPAIGCHCGITALARFAEDDAHWSSVDVFGAIEAWSEETCPIPGPGGVAAAAGVEVKGDPQPEHTGFVLHQNGFRARYGKVVLLAVDDEWPSAKRAAVRALAREHHADACKRAHLEDAAKEHGQLVPDELLKWVKDNEPEPALLAGGAFIPPLWLGHYATNAHQYTISTTSWLSPAPSKPRIKKGIRETLGYNGPPSHGKFRKDDRVRDRSGDTWRCVKGGKPGSWECEC